MKKAFLAIGTGAALVLAVILGGTGAALAAGPGDPFSVTKYGTQFIYHGDGNWVVVNTDNAQALKDIDSTQAVLCSNYDTGLGKPCVPGASYSAKSTAFNKLGQNCIYVQGDGGNHGSWDTVPNTEKEACAPTTPPTSSPSPTVTTTPSPTPSGTPTSTPTPTTTPEPTRTPTATPSPSSSSSPTPTPTTTLSPEPSSTPSPNATASVTVSEEDLPTTTSLAATGAGEAFWPRVVGITLGAVAVGLLGLAGVLYARFRKV